MPSNRHRRERPPLDAESLWSLALHYVGRYATTEAKLRSYLQRKVRERGWAGAIAPDYVAITRKCADSGYVDDAGFAAARALALARRGLGAGRIDAALRGAGIDGALAAAVAPGEADARAAAETFARRKRIGAFASTPADPDRRRRDLARMLRAGHPFELAREYAYADGSGSMEADPD